MLWTFGHIQIVGAFILAREGNGHKGMANADLSGRRPCDVFYQFSQQSRHCLLEALENRPLQDARAARSSYRFSWLYVQLEG